MKKLFTSLALAAMTIASPVMSQAKTVVMGADKPAAEVTAYDLEGKYAMTYYSLIVENGTFLGNLLNFVYLDVEAVDETSLILHHFYHEDCDPIDATFDPETMTITVPNNFDLGTWYYNRGETNETSFHLYLKLYDLTAPQPNTLSDNDIVFKVDRENRVLRFDVTNTEKVREELMVVKEDESLWVEKFRWINYDYTNFISTYNAGETPIVTTVPHFADLDEENNMILAYNYNCQGWHDLPVEWKLNADRTKMTATNQIYLYDPTIPDFNFWLSEAGKMDPYELTADILNGEDGYDIQMPVWTYYDRYGRCFRYYYNYKGHISGEFFGETCEKPVITPGVYDFQEGDKVSITAPEGAEIYYTTDGSVPTENSISYSNPFEIAPNTCVKAIAVVPGKLASFVTVNDYSLTGVHSVAADTLGVYVENGKVIAPYGAQLFDINGSQLDMDATLSAGIYIVTLNGKTAKLYVK